MPNGTVLVKSTRQNLVPGDKFEIIDPLPGPGPEVAVIIMQFLVPLNENLIGVGICAVFVKFEVPETIEALIVPPFNMSEFTFIPN